MVKKPFKGKYLELKVRVSYDEKTDSVHITSKDKDLPTERGFHLSLNGGRDAEYTLRTLLEREGLIPREKFRAIPERINFKDAINTEQWDKFPLGLAANGEEAVWDTSISSNILIAGGAGSGKTIIQQNIIFHCLRHSKNWVFFGIDLNRVSLSPYLKYGAPVKSVATTLETALETVTNAYDEIRERVGRMNLNAVTNFKDLPAPPPAWMLMIDECAVLLAQSPNTTDEGKAENLLVEEIQEKISKIARLGRSAGVHLVIASQRVDAPVFHAGLKEDCTARIAAGRMDGIASQIFLDNDKATHLNGAIRGRGYFQQFGGGYDFQGYFSTLDWPYEAGIVSRDQ